MSALPPPPQPSGLPIPAATGPAGPPPAELTVDLTFGQRHRRVFDLVIGFLALCAVVCLAMAAAAALPAAYGLVAAAAVWGLATYGLVRLRRRVFAPRSLVFDRRGVRHATGDHRAFAVEWTELAQARTSYARKPGPIRNPLTWGGVTADAAPGQNPATRFGVSTFVRLDLVPNDPAFLERHDLKVFRRWTGRPETAPADPAPWSEDLGGRQAIIRIPFGDMPELLAGVDAALRTFAGDRYHPPVNEGLAWGFKYS